MAGPTGGTFSSPISSATVLPAPNRWGELCPAWERYQCESLCENGSALSCARLGRILVLGGADNALMPMPTFEPDPTGARAAWDKACAAGYLPACSDLAWLYREGHGGSKQPAKARALDERACKAGLGSACYGLVEQATPAARAVALYEQGCAAGHAASCLEAGGYYESGEGVPEDMSKALKLYGRAFFAPVAAEGALRCPPETRLFREVREMELAYVLVEPALYCGRPGKRRPVKHGPFLEWPTLEDEAAYPAGVVSEQGEYRDGEREGPWVKRDDRGRVRWRGTYRAGKEEGEVEEIGTSYGRDVTRTTYSAGKRHGPYRRERDDRIESGQYDQGKKVGKWMTTRDGKKEHEESYVAGEREGEALSFHEDGRISSRTSYQAGKPVGTSKSYDRSGQLSEETEYLNGKRARTRRYWKGTKTEIRYDEEGDETSRQEWDANGKLVR